MTGSLVFGVGTIVLTVGVLVALARTLRRPGLLCRLERDGDELVVRLDGAPVVLCFRRRLSTPLSGVRAVRPVAAGTRERLHARVMGTSWPGSNAFNGGFFWTRGDGFSFVVRRRRRDALEIEMDGDRIRRWIVEVDPAAAVVRELVSGQDG